MARSGTRPELGQYFPWERPEPSTWLHERLVRRQISRVHWALQPLPTGHAGLGLEFDDGQRLLMIAAPVPAFAANPYAARLLFRLLAAQKIWTPGMHRHFLHGREPGERPPDFLQRQLEGAMVVGHQAVREPAADGGEQTRLMLRIDGKTSILTIRAAPDGPGAALDVQVTQPPPRLISVPRGNGGALD